MPLAAGPVAWLFARVAGERFPGVVETLYGGALGAWIGGAFGRATGWFGFSLAEIVLVVFVAAELLRIGRALATRGKARRGRARRAGIAALRVARDLSVVVAVFYLVWGLHYARPRLPDRNDWPPLVADPALLAGLAQEQARLANDLYRELHGGEDDAGVPTTMADPQALDRALDAAWPVVVDEMGLPSTAAFARGPVKPLLLSPLLHRLGLSGFYFPFTGEANVNRGVPAARRAHVMAHEKAHQRGIGPEDEANFLGWRVAATADDPLARYAAAVFAHGQLARTLSRTDPERARRAVDLLLPGVRRDLQDVRDYWARAEGPARDVSERVNHAYLRGNRVEGGIASYGRSVELLVRFARTRGESLAAPARAAGHAFDADASERRAWPSPREVAPSSSP